MDNNKREDSSLYDEIPSRTEEYHKRNRAKQSLRKKICAICLVVLLIGFYGIGAFALNILNHTRTAMSKAYSPTGKDQTVSQVLKDKKPFSVLLMGTDTGDLGRTFKGRTDTMIVMTVNPQTEKITMTSIPRDTAVHISGSNNEYDKINSAYTYGGTDLAVKTVEKTLDIPINFYMLINMGGLVKVIDDLGGVTVTPPLTFSYQNVSVTKGKTVKLDGKQALSYSRMRDDDPQGDYGRQKRQKQILTAIIKKAMSASSLTKYNKTINAIQGSLKTDLSYDDLMMIESYYKDAGKHVSSRVLQGHTEMLSGLSYQVATAAEKRKISNEIRHQLGLKDSDYNFEKDSLSQLEGDGSSDDDSTTDTTSTGNGYGSATGNVGTGYGTGTGYGNQTTTASPRTQTQGYGTGTGAGTGTANQTAGTGTGAATGNATGGNYGRTAGATGTGTGTGAGTTGNYGY